jgi:hypothetical protein
MVHTTRRGGVYDAINRHSSARSHRLQSLHFYSWYASPLILNNTTTLYIYLYYRVVFLNLITSASGSVALAIICIVAVALAGPTSNMRWIGLTIVQGILMITFSVFALSRTYVQVKSRQMQI